MSETPPFWYKDTGMAAWALAPIGWVYGKVSSRRMLQKGKAVSTVPVICIGNLVAGGAGKTPTAVALAKIARTMGFRPGFLSRGYGGHVSSPTIVDIKTHNAKDVGDEPMILGLYGTTVVSADRPAGAALLEQEGVDLIIMDDGFQNPSLHKDFSLVVVDSGRGIGNGHCIPAGPLRVPVNIQMAAASAILLVGNSQKGASLVRIAAKMAKPVLQADIVPRRADDMQETDVLAFTGIADPSKFYASLEAAGANIVMQRSFPDHHPFSADECSQLLDDARANQLTLVTTEKDSVRLIRAGSIQQDLRAACKLFAIDLEFENPKMVESIIRDTVAKAATFRLSK